MGSLEKAPSPYCVNHILGADLGFAALAASCAKCILVVCYRSCAARGMKS